MIILITVLVTILVIWFLFPIIQVCGSSMFPTYHDGEVIVGNKLIRKSKLKVGDVILYKNKYKTNGKVVIKRIDKKVKGIDNKYYFYCLGDNSKESYDSRYYGYIRSKDIICKVINQRNKGSI